MVSDRQTLQPLVRPREVIRKVGGSSPGRPHVLSQSVPEEDTWPSIAPRAKCEEAVGLKCKSRQINDINCRYLELDTARDLWVLNILNEPLG